MAAAALLRSMARKLARAPTPPPHPRPLLAAGFHGGARSGPGGSLPPLTSNQIQQGSGDRLVVGMASAAGLRSGAALPSLATKIARAPPQPHHRHTLNRGVHSSTTAPPTSDKDKIIEELRLRLWHARASAGLACFMLAGIAIYGYFGLLPEVEKERERLKAMKKLKPEDEPPSVSLAQILATKGYRKQQRNGTTEMGTMVDKLQVALMEVCLDILKETAAGLEEARADFKETRAALKETRAAIDQIAKLAPPKQKEGCSRGVGSETVAC